MERAAGRTLQDATRLPSLQSTLDKQWTQLNTEFPQDVLTLGWAGSQEVLITQEDRESHMHIVGTTGEGKSKFLEYLICRDIDRLSKGATDGLCFLDPSAKGMGRDSTIANILRYCATKGFEKVILIDPDNNDVVCPINPLNYEHEYEAIKNITDTIRTVFLTKDFAQQGYIRRFLPTVFRVLLESGLTLHHAKYFAERDSDQHIREKIFDLIPRPNRYVTRLEKIFDSASLFNSFQTTINRLDVIYNSPLDLMFGCKVGLDFERLISDGWVILVNLSPGRKLDKIETRFLATAIVSEINSAILRLRDKQFSQPYYLYIDECGTYATDKVSEILELKRQIKLRFILAHQYEDQLGALTDAVVKMTKIKVAFYMTDPDDRYKTVKMLGYGGELSTKEVADAFALQPKQTAVIRRNRENPRVTRIPDVPTPNCSDRALDGFIRTLYKNPVYKLRKDVEAEHKQFEYVQSRTIPNPQPVQTPPQANNKTNRKSARPANLWTTPAKTTGPAKPPSKPNGPGGSNS